MDHPMRSLQIGFRPTVQQPKSWAVQISKLPGGGRTTELRIHIYRFDDENVRCCGSGALEHASILSRRLDPSLTWEDVRWLRQKWKKRLVIKGILSAEDAKTAQDTGADAIVISNHGGRQLDFASSTIGLLPEIRKAVGPDSCVMTAGGFRRGSEIVIVLGLGASGVLPGRAYSFGLSAQGQEGVQKPISILADEIKITLKLMGLNSIKELQAKGAECVYQIA